MSDHELALLALLGASAAATGGLVLSGRGPVERPSVWYRLLWPRDVDAGGVTAFLRQLAGDRRRHVLALEVVASGGRLSYRMGIAKRHSEAVLAALGAHLPGVAAEIIEHDIVHAPDYAWQVSLSSAHRALRTVDPDEIARSLTSSLASASMHHTVIFQWLLGPRLQPVSAPLKGSPAPATTWGDVLRQTVSGKASLDAEAHRSIKDKVEETGFRCICRIGVDAPNARMAQAAASRVLAALRATEAPGVHIKLKRDDPDKLAATRHPRSWPLAVNVKELTALCGWPLGGQAYPGSSAQALASCPQAKPSHARGASSASRPIPATNGHSRCSSPTHSSTFTCSDRPASVSQRCCSI